MKPSKLHTPLKLRSVELKNRIAISPMCQYSADNGFVNDWHLVHLGRFAIGGAGLIFVEATAIVPEGRISYGDLGLWSDAHIPGLRRIAEFLKSQGAIPAIQLAHAGRKASMQRPWHGNGPLGEADFARGESGWDIVAPSEVPATEDSLVPRALSVESMAELKSAWVTAAKRSLEAGFEVLELHCAHGYLLHEFLSPLANCRSDDYGGNIENRCRFPLEVAKELRRTWPEDRPMFVRVSAVDGVEGGWQLQDTIYFAKRLREIGVDVIDCSSGGLGGSATANRTHRGIGFQVRYASAVRREVGIQTMAVGLILEPDYAEQILQENHADIIAIGREAMFNPNWALHSEQWLLGEPVFENWPQQAGWWLEHRARALSRIGSGERGTDESLINIKKYKE